MSPQIRQLAVFFSILLLCIGVCFEMPGIPGDMFDFDDTDTDVFHASVILGCTIHTPSVSDSVSPPTYYSRMCDSPQSHDSLRADSLFHPPIIA